MITAPYNFVPFNKKVFYPSWSEQVNHDIPFEDGESGEIDITITAKSPIFISDHEKKEEFCQYNGKYYIPSSSVKGMVRNVLEIMSFSKMNPAFVDDKTYAIRDLRNRELYMSKMKPENTFCGWLKKDGDSYIVEDCGIPGRISQDEIDNIFNLKFAKKFKDRRVNNGEFVNKPQFKTSKYKYELLKSKDLTQSFDLIKKDKGREVYKKGKEKTGTIVLTGQASARKDKGKFDAKIYEFVFFKSNKKLSLSKEVFDNFKFAYFDGRKTEPKESPDWGYWKKELEKGRKVPIFFQKKDNLILHIGLSYLYKLPYKHSVHDGLYDIHNNKKLDLSQTIFGYTDESNALKGRIQFSHFKIVKNTISLQKRTEILGTPRASYYPMYIYQNGKIYSTYMDDDFLIAGRKRYPIHKSDDPIKSKETGNKNVGTTFIPLNSGVIFKGKLRYHNLKRCELGAILSALTFHNTPNTYHNIGMAKSLGYGKIDITIDNFKVENYLNSYEKVMTNSIKNWAITEEITELLTMATEQNNSGNSLLEYIELPEFASAKNSIDFLKRYTKLNDIKTIKLKRIILNQEKTKKQKIIKETIQPQSTLSKTKMNKAIINFWDKMFDTRYHKNQIEEFLSKEGFISTPNKQREYYIKNKNNEKFLFIVKLVDKFNKNILNEKQKISLYKMMTKIESKE